MSHSTSSSIAGKTGAGGLALAALGVVYGDIGTSPLYALKETFGSPHHPVPITPDNVLGILSVVFWALMLVVTGKYVSFIMRADNRGEGGIMALMALALRDERDGPQRRIVLMLGLAGAALFYGDGVVTPAISVLSAVEGLAIITPAFEQLVIPLALVVLTGLFLIQRHGTASVGKLFGPVMLLWFATLTVLGLTNIVAAPGVVRALNPAWGIAFFINNPLLGFFTLGAVVLVLTGGEALYADMGHFGRRPIQLAWYSVVLPALLINYFGQGALLLSNPAAVENPFYRMAPGWALIPLLLLSTMATVIASQAVISGAFSLTQQAIQLGYTPRLRILHTSEREMGQIYLPAINWLLLGSVIALVLGFKSSSNLAAAYGIAVTGTMLITNLLAFVVIRQQWRWNRWRALACVVPFALVDVAFFAANSLKIADGGWFPLVFGLFVLGVLTTWKRGRELLSEKLGGSAISLNEFIASLALGGATRVPGTAVFLTSRPEGVPRTMLHSLKHYKVLHERMVIVTIQFFDVPYVPEIDRVEVHPLDENFWQITVQYGFRDEPDLPHALELCAHFGLEFDMMATSFFLGRDTLLVQRGKEMAYWRVLLFATMYRNANSFANFFKIPSNRVVELGSQVAL
ncbi:potassium transporter Kup [Propionivibrio limicola]|uniref:potassium transporter Kup n=1 Tax=Propionivibrio limicola TaxID=167645 RepID=UPI0012919657|nr:potassium transporter Kup [Propionivibrio limicola]